MKGDFSVWRNDHRDNDQGVLFQQGRVTLDADLSAAELIDLHWRTQAARDVIGAAVAAVPAEDSDGFHVDSAAVIGDQVHLAVRPGRIWADGVLVSLPPDPADPTKPLDRVATYFEPPLNPAGTASDSIGDNVRDAVILELALQELNAFQEPPRLLEPALGGPDTAERISVDYSFRLLRLGAGEDCTTILDKLADKPAGKGRLSVSLEPESVVPGDCPVVMGGGYTGFEHNLYRVEIAASNSGGPRFKWSQMNGGLVGRGIFQAGPPHRVVITANRTPILTSEMTEFYLEALAYDAALGHWRVVYGTLATLNTDQDLELADPPVFGTFTFGADPVFFRLWNGLADVAAFTNAATPEELRDGIRLVFDNPSGATYRPGDYWTFSVRAGEITNQQVLIDAQPPAGVIYRRVPLAEIDWTSARDTTVSGALEDCRHRFQPLTNQRTCCTLLVGDGVHTFGDFNSLEEAATHLPASGGELCLLPGVHLASLSLINRRNVRIHGCARRTRVLPRMLKNDQPIFSLTDCEGIEIADLDLVSYFGPAIVARGTRPRGMQDLRITSCRILARTYGIRIIHGQDITIVGNRIAIVDTDMGRAAIQLRAVRALVERNYVTVWPAEVVPPRPPDDGNSPPINPTDPCAEPEVIYGHLSLVLTYAVAIWQTVLLVSPAKPYRAWGGIHLLGACENIRLLENRIDGGAGHGVTLGGVLPGDDRVDEDGDPARGPFRVSVQRPGSSVIGYLSDETRAPLSGLAVYLASDAGTVGQDTSDSQGAFEIKAEEGAYTLSVEPGLEIRRVAVAESELGRVYTLELRKGTIDVPEDRAFLYDIIIQENEIQRMALSGIGFRYFTARIPTATLPGVQQLAALVTGLAAAIAPRELVGTCNVVRDLVIRGNRIHHNLRTVFDEDLRRSTLTVGQGGISLALVESAAIVDNHIHDNGLSAINAVCGVFVGLGEDVDISGNQIVGNGPIPADFETGKAEGVRGGIFVRLASAFLPGGTTDARENPALRVANNRVDQPAGRAITAFAFGPVSCVGNYLNSEHAGRWSVYDTLVGGALILNLGGLQRQQRFVAAGAAVMQDVPAPTAARLDFRDAQLAEQLLPGGEVLFNSNQIRLGPRHLSAASVLVGSLDDIGFDGNQSSVFRPDLLFSNSICLGYTVRATDNRFREHTEACYFSLLTLSYGFTNQARLSTMNTTAHDQGDHCIIAISNAPQAPANPPPFGLPVVEQGNLEANSAFCRRIAAERSSLGTYLARALQQAIVGQLAPTVGTTSGANVKATTATATSSIAMLSSQYHHVYAAEATRLEQQLGPADPRVQLARGQLATRAEAIRQLNVETELLTIQEASPPSGGSVVDGRIMDTTQRGRAGQVVELVRADGSRSGVAATTDATGYFAIQLNADQAAQLARAGVFVQVSDPAGNVLQRSTTPLAVGAGVVVRTSLTLPVQRVPAEILARATPIFTAVTPPPRTSTPLESVRGIGPATAGRLRQAGIPDVETLLETPGERLVELAGFDASVLRQRARDVLTNPTPARRRRSRETEPPPR